MAILVITMERRMHLGSPLIAALGDGSVDAGLARLEAAGATLKDLGQGVHCDHPVTLGYAPLDPTRVISEEAPEPRFFDVIPNSQLFPVRAGPLVTHETFRWVPGDPVPITKEREFDDGNPIISDSVTVLDQTGGSWLTAAVPDTPTSEVLNLSVNPTGLTTGRYNAAVLFRREDTPTKLDILPVILDVTDPPELLVDTTTLEFRTFVNEAAPDPQTLFVNARIRALDFSIAVSTASGGDWLSVDPSASGTPRFVTVTASAAGLAPGIYEGALSVTAANASNSPQIVPVRMTIVQRTPFFTAESITNAASFQSGGISPGEMVTFFGTRIGPQPPAGLQLVGGRVATRVADTRILFDGDPGPIIAVSSTQSTCIVPYSVLGKTTVSVVIEFQGARSLAVSVPVMSVWPGIFTASATGAGQGAILNQNGTVNSATNRADRGSVISLYITGVGQTLPAGDAGAVNAPPLPLPLLPVAVRIGGVDAVVEFAGGAPSIVAGVIQVNARVNLIVVPGAAVPVEVTVGGIPAQRGVTVAIQ